MAVDVRYRNFFIPRVVKNLKISPWEEKAHLPRAHFWRFFQPLGWRNFYTRHQRPFGKPIPVWVYICAKSVFFREIVMRTRHPGGNGNGKRGSKLINGRIKCRKIFHQFKLINKTLKFKLLRIIWKIKNSTSKMFWPHCGFRKMRKQVNTPIKSPK